MDRRAAWVIGIVFGGLLLCLFGFLVVLSLALGSSGKSRLGSRDSVGIVEIQGPITDSKDILKTIKDFRESTHIKAVVVRIDSPGGAVGPSQEIYTAVRKLAKTKKVVASMGSMAASGGFYIACAAERVFANPGTLTGSIGVIFQLPDVQGLMKWAGVNVRTLTAGKLKDSGSPFKDLTPEERAYFDSMLHDVHEQFIEAVAEGRKLTPDEVRPSADGRVFTGRQAKELKLVDELGGFDDAVASAAALAGMGDDSPTLEYPEKERGLLEDLLGEEARSVLRGAAFFGLQYRLPMMETP